MDIKKFKKEHSTFIAAGTTLLIVAAAAIVWLPSLYVQSPAIFSCATSVTSVRVIPTLCNGSFI